MERLPFDSHFFEFTPTSKLFAGNRDLVWIPRGEGYTRKDRIDVFAYCTHTLCCSYTYIEGRLDLHLVYTFGSGHRNLTK